MLKSKVNEQMIVKSAQNIHFTQKAETKQNFNLIKYMDIVRDKLGYSTYLWLKLEEENCVNLLALGENLKYFNKKEDYLAEKLPLLFENNVFREYSFMILPFAKAYEGVLLRLLVIKELLSKEEFVAEYINIGKYYKNQKIHEAVMKEFVVKKKDKSRVDKLYGDWNEYRNRLLHYDISSFITSRNEAKQIIDSIYVSIKIAYDVFIGKYY